MKRYAQSYATHVAATKRAFKAFIAHLIVAAFCGTMLLISIMAAIS